MTRRFAPIVALAVASLAATANAAIVNYANVSAPGITITNISESTSDGVGHYGQAVLTGGTLSFPSINFSTSATGTTLTSQNNQIVSTLNFTVTINPAVNPLFSLTENGSFSGDHNAWATLAAGFVITDINGNILPVSPTAANIIPLVPFVAAGPGNTAFNWSATVAPTGPAGLTTYIVHLDNDLFVSAPATGVEGVSSHVTLTKNNLTICFKNCVPEPASLGVLGTGAALLFARRRKA